MSNSSRIIRIVVGIAVLLAAVPAIPEVLEVLHDFENPPVRPLEGLTSGPGTTLYGVAEGGQFGAGSVFAFSLPSASDPGEVSTFASLPNVSMWPAYPTMSLPDTPLVRASNNYLYGTRGSWSNESRGAIYRVSPTGDYEVVHEFTAAEGRRPYGRLVEVQGDLYGTLYFGNYTTTFGAVYRLDTSSNTVQVLHAFVGGSEGENPEGGLAFRPSDQMLYGTTRMGGAEDCGTIFRISPSGGSFETLHHFSATSPGLAPTGELTVGPDGLLYGAATYGAYPKAGSVFRFDPATNVLTVLHAFNTTDGNGTNPMGGMIVTGNALFGVATAKSSGYYATVFRIDLAAGGNFQVLRQGTGKDNFSGRLVLASDGFIYGIATGYHVGPTGGEIFRIDPSTGGVSTVHRFGVSARGRAPFSLVESSPGVLHMTTHEGGAENRGAVLRRSSDGALDTVFSFQDGESDGDSRNPTRTFLTPARDGLLYGVRSDGGPSGQGSVFTLDPGSGEYNLLTALTSDNYVWVPYGQLIESATDAGTFYGTTIGTLQYGTVFEMTSSGATAWLTPPGRLAPNLYLTEPVGRLIEMPDGTLYGTFRQWFGDSEYLGGGVFRLVPGGAAQVLKQFSWDDGWAPVAGLTLGPPAADGTPLLYGVTAKAGQGGGGGVFSITANGAFARLHSFQGPDGAQPLGELVLAADGKLYGMTWRGGARDFGTLFVITPGAGFEKVHDFDWATGAKPESTLVAGADGNLYGLTAAGGAEGGGVMFRYNLAPTAAVGGPYEVLEGGTVTLGAGGSDPQGAPLTFAWDLDGDGDYDDATGASVDFAATTTERDGDGAYDVVVRATDVTGISAIAETTVTVRNVAPQVSAGGDVSVELGGALSRVGSFTDPGPDTWTATVDYGDGSGPVALALAGSDFTLDHVYVDRGSFAVVVTVTDDDGGTGSASFQVEVGTVEDEIGGLIDDIEELLDDGTLKLGQGKSLIGKLELALYMLKWGNTTKAITMLEAFIQEVEAFLRAGILTPEQGDPLLAKAQAAIASLR